MKVGILEHSESSVGGKGPPAGKAQGNLKSSSGETGPGEEQILSGLGLLIAKIGGAKSGAIAKMLMIGICN